ncbi:hypothetical protein BH10PAT3_BH10PAT3_1390 [soil metagenome]
MKAAPDFTLPDPDALRTKLKDYYGKWLVVYLYPRDDTPGCTTEVCNFRDARDATTEYGRASVVGIS